MTSSILLSLFSQLDMGVGLILLQEDNPGNNIIFPIGLTILYRYGLFLLETKMYTVCIYTFCDMIVVSDSWTRWFFTMNLLNRFSNRTNNSFMNWTEQILTLLISTTHWFKGFGQLTSVWKDRSQNHTVTCKKLILYMQSMLENQIVCRTWRIFLKKKKKTGELSSWRQQGKVLLLLGCIQ